MVIMSSLGPKHARGQSQIALPEMYPRYFHCLKSFNASKIKYAWHVPEEAKYHNCQNMHGLSIHGRQ